MAALNSRTENILDALEKCGYSRSMSEKRIQIYDNCNKIGSSFYRRKSKEDIDIVIAGSRGEGIAVFFDCDVDRLFIQRSAMCFYSYPEAADRQHFEVEFELDFENTPSGYCQLRLMSISTDRDHDAGNVPFLKNIKSAIEERNGRMFLRNDRMLTSAMSHSQRHGWLAGNFVYDVSEGPAKPFLCNLPFTEYSFKIDDVLALQCSYPSIVKEWADRQRPNDWPSKDVIDEVRSLDVLVVPVGETEDDVLHWRISLVLAELALVHSFSDMQLKVYGTLKMLAKNVLKKSCEKMSSYIMKNVMFWISEKTDTLNFERNQFLPLLTDGLKYLRKCVYNRNLPNYMIPGRNLLKYKVTDSEREELLQNIGSFLEGGSLLKRVETILESTTETSSNIIESKEIVEQVVISLYSIPPPEGAEMVEQLFNMKTGLEVMYFYQKQVFPIIRKNNPFGFFHHFVSKTDEELLAFVKRSESTKLESGMDQAAVCPKCKETISGKEKFGEHLLKCSGELKQFWQRTDNQDIERQSDCTRQEKRNVSPETDLLQEKEKKLKRSETKTGEETGSFRETV